MKREFVEYNIALRLKNLGFDEACAMYWRPEMDGSMQLWYHQEERFDEAIGSNNSDNANWVTCTAPTFSQAFRWIRETHQIFPEVVTDCTAEPKFAYTYTRFFGNPKDLGSEEWGWENNIGQYSLLYRTYEDAQRDCLEEILAIIEKENGRNS
jgi:hypothetical protein